jgi:hypothetical protein
MDVIDHVADADRRRCFDDPAWIAESKRPTQILAE